MAADGDGFGARPCPTAGDAPRGEEAMGDMALVGEREWLLDCDRAWATVDEYAAEKDLELVGGCGLAAFML